MTAMNAGGEMKASWFAHYPNHSDKNRRIRLLGVIVGAILGSILLLTVVFMLVKVVRRRQFAYQRMEGFNEPGYSKTKGDYDDVPYVNRSTEQEVSSVPVDLTSDGHI